MILAWAYIFFVGFWCNLAAPNQRVEFHMSMRRSVEKLFINSHSTQYPTRSATEFL